MMSWERSKRTELLAIAYSAFWFFWARNSFRFSGVLGRRKVVPSIALTQCPCQSFGLLFIDAKEREKQENLLEGGIGNMPSGSRKGLFRNRYRFMRKSQRHKSIQIRRECMVRARKKERKNGRKWKFSVTSERILTITISFTKLLRRESLSYRRDESIKIVIKSIKAPPKMIKDKKDIQIDFLGALKKSIGIYNKF